MIITAHAHHGRNDETMSGLTLRIEGEENELEECIKKFPKYVKLELRKIPLISGGILVDVAFEALFPVNSKTAGLKNEVSIKRTDKLLDILEKNNLEIIWKTPFLNSVKTIEDFKKGYENYRELS